MSTTSILSFRPSKLSTSATPNHRNTRHRNQPSSTNWWTPLFGWSSEPDYIINNNKPESIKKQEPGAQEPDDVDNNPAATSHSCRRSTFTDEKAKRLRMLTTSNDTSSFHDAMYHSAIASRLASDFSDRSDD